MRINTAQLKTAVEDLRQEVEARSRLTTILEATSDLVLMSLPDDSVAYINRAGRELVGWDADDDLSEKQTRKIFSKPTRRLIRTEVVPTAERDGLWEGEATVLGPDQNEIPVSMVVMTHRTPDGKTDRFSAIMRDISERRKAREALLDSREQLRALAAELAAAEDRERRRIATYLHDQIGQALAVLRIRFGALKMASDPADAEKLVTEISDLLEWAIEETNTLTFDLSPPILYELGLEAALEWVGETLCEKHDVVFSFVGAEQKISLTEEMASLLFRCARELVMNVVKHAKAQHVVIKVATQANSISITVEDDGAGFDTSVLANDRRMDRFGLYSIRERMTFIGGEFTVDSDPGQGTRATIATGVAGGASRNGQE